MKKNKVSSSASSLIEKFKGFDEFSEQASLNLGNDLGDKYRSCMGACLSALIFGITSVFLYSKIMVLYHSSDVTIMMSTQEDALTHDYKFTAEDGLFLAAALTEYDSNTEVIEDPRYGELVIEHYGWGNDGLKAGSSPVDYHFCSDEELGFSPGPNTNIFPIFSSSVNEVKTWKKKFKCLNKKDMVIWGSYDSQKGQQVTVKFKMCEHETYCESKEKIKQWLSGKYIVLLYNQIRFEPQEFLEKSKIEESRISWIPISSQVR